MIDELFFHDLFVEGHVAIQIEDTYVFNRLEDEGACSALRGLDEALEVDLGSPLTFGLGPRAIFFVGIDGEFIVLEG